MAKSLNRVELKGHVGFDPRINKFEDGESVMRFSLATNETFKNRKGELVEETVWHSIVAWTTGKGVTDFDTIKKGSYLHIIGRLKPVRYQTKEGADKFSYEVIALNIKVGDTDETDSESDKQQ